MYRQILNSELKELSPEAKFLLVRFILAYGRVPSSAITESELRRLTGLSRYLFGQARRELEGLGYLARKVEVAAWRGENTDKHHVYSLGAKTLDLLASTVPPRCIWNDLVEDLISGRIGLADAPLKPSNRLLLVILFTRANEFGVVRGVGESTLRRLTGLNENRLKIHLHKLKALEYLRSVVSGVSEGSLFGVATGAHFLNTNHPDLGRHRSQASVFVNTAPRGFRRTDIDRFDASYAYRMYEVVNAALPRSDHERLNRLAHTSQQPITEMSEAVSGLFVALSRAEVRGYQQYKLEEYASYLLSSHWDSLEGGEPPHCSELEDQVLTQFRGHATEDVASTEGQEELRQAMTAVLGVAFQLAKDVYKGMSHFSDVPFGSMKHCVLPRRIERGGQLCIPVLSLLKDRRERDGVCCVLTEWPNRKPEREVFEGEDAIPLADRWAYGLLADPMESSKRYRSFMPNRAGSAQESEDNEDEVASD